MRMIAKLMLGVTLLFFKAPAQSEWVWRNPLPQGNGLLAVAWTGSQLVAVGDLGTVMTFPEGAVWTPRNSGSGANLKSVAWTGADDRAPGRVSGE
jgi:hypothetical protein